MKDLPKVHAWRLDPGFEPATLQMEGAELTTKPLRPMTDDGAHIRPGLKCHCLKVEKQKGVANKELLANL